MKLKAIETFSEDSRPVICSVWGLNDCGQLLSNDEQIVKHPTILQCPKGIFGFVSGDFHTLLISDSLKLSSAGLNIYGQLGVSSTTLKEPNTHVLQEISTLAGQTIEMAACGSCHSVALTTDGTLYSWGLNLKGQLGLGHFDNVSEPISISTLSNTKIDSAAKKSLVGVLKTQRQMTRNSSLLRKGTTQQVKEQDESAHVILSQRSLSAEKKLFSQSMESKKSLKPEGDSPDAESLNPMPGSVLGIREKIVEIACGSLHTLLRTNCRRVLSSGYGGLYALGHKDPDTISTFKPINFFTERNIAIIKIACGPNSSACIAQEGSTYIWGVVGYSSYDKPIMFKLPSRLPFEGSTNPSLESKGTPYKGSKIKPQPPTLAAAPYVSQKRATDVKMGDGFVLVLTESGTVYSFGANHCGQLGAGDTKPHEYAEKVKGLPTTVTQISCGNDHCLAIDNEYCLYAWGSNKYGQLGDEILDEKAVAAHKISAFEKVEVFKVSCGSYSSFCLSYGRPHASASPQVKKDVKKEEELKKEVKTLQSEVAKLRLELAIKSELQTSKIPKGKIAKPGDKMNGWRPCFEIDVKDLVYEEKITEGGYGIVYLGKWHETRVAIKEIKMEYVTQDKLDEFLTECTTMEVVRHPNIVLFLGACTKPPKLCIVLEYCEMGSLWTLLHFTKTELPWKLRKQIALDIARSVNYLHCFPTPLLHRDLKSLNVLLDNNLTAKLADFGWARMKETVMTGKIGTYQWMAPEVIASAHYTEKADVYSFGVIMWEIACRKPPYYGIDVSEVAHRVVHQGYRPPIKDGDAPYSWTALMKRCWQKDPSKRPSFAQIIHELEQIKEY